MATKSKSKSKTKDNKNLIIGICCLAVVALAAIVAVVLVSNSGLNDGYFVSDDTKYVFTLESDEKDLSEDEDAPVKTHIVYTYEGDKVTGLKSYYVYADADKAKTAFDKMKESAGEEESNSIELNGKYIIITAEEDVYKDLTASDVKQQIEFMESLKNTNTEELDEQDQTEATEEDDDEE